MNELFRNELLVDEEILWTGQPDPSIIFSLMDFYLIPFSIVWGGFSMFWEFSVIKTGAPFFFCLFGIPFVLIGLYLIVGRFIHNKIKKNHTFYAVTNQRILIISGILGKNLQAKFIDQIPNINKKVRSNGTGTITFGDPPFGRRMYNNNGMDLSRSSYSYGIPTFYDINDADNVYRLVTELNRG